MVRSMTTRTHQVRYHAMSETERRRYPRKTHVAHVALEVDGRVIEAVTEDLSLGGVKIKLEAPEEALPVGATLRVKFELPEVEFPVDVGAEVRWEDRIDGRYLGLQFTEGLRAAHVWSLDRL